MLRYSKQSVFFSLPRKFLNIIEETDPIKVKKYFWVKKKGEKEKTYLDINSLWFESSEVGSIEWKKDREGFQIKIYDWAWKHLQKNRKKILKQWEEDRKTLPPKIPVQTNSKTNAIQIRVNLLDKLEDKIYELFLQ